MKETKQKKEGAWMSPKEIAQKMINFIEDDFYKGNVLEPTAGEGAIVLEILNKKLSIGMTPQEAINTTYANEFDEGRYNTLLNNINQWCIEHGCNIEINNIKLGDAAKVDFNDWIGNENEFGVKESNFNVITNLPFGSFTDSMVPRRIINNLSDHRAVYLTKWTTGCYKKYVPHVKKFENIVFPGIRFDTLLWEYDPEYTEGNIWIYWPIQKFPVHKLMKEHTTTGTSMKLKEYLNHYKSPAIIEIDRRAIENGLQRSGYMKSFSKAIFIEPPGDISNEQFDNTIWYEAYCNAQMRTLLVPKEIILDWLYNNGYKDLFEDERD